MSEESKNIGDVIKNKLIKKNQYLVCYRLWNQGVYAHMNAFIDVEEKEKSYDSANEIYNAIIDYYNKHSNNGNNGKNITSMSDIIIIVLILTRLN